MLDLVLQEQSQVMNDEDDEGMGADEDEPMHTEHIIVAPAANDSGYASTSYPSFSSPDVSFPAPMSYGSQRLKLRSEHRMRHSAPASLPALLPPQYPVPNYKLLYLSHTRIYSRILASSYRVSVLQTRATTLPVSSYLGPHTSTIYCLALYTHPRTGVQTLFTGSKDHTVREWDLRTGTVLRIISGIHQSSVLSLSVGDGYVATGGSDRKVVVWELEPDDGTECRLVGVIGDHTDSVLCVRFDHQRLVSCSKGK
jgi:WD40 repeat protein